MHDRIAYLANVSVARACGFAGLAITTVAVGLSHEPALCFQAAGYLSLLACITLIIKAFRAAEVPYKRTEVWIMLRPEDRPSAHVAQELIARTLRDTYLRFARLSALVTIIWLAMALIYRLIFT